MFERVLTILQDYTRREMSAEGLTPAAVLVPLFIKDDEPHLLMGKRSERVLHHKRQISFPGGVCEPEDVDAVDTALREAWEEVGLEREHVRVLGLLGDIQTITGYRVTPVVGTIPYPYEFKMSTVEVEEILEVPWGVFARPRVHRREVVERNGHKQDVDFYGFGPHTIWGATARITRQLVELVEGQVLDPLEEK